MTDPKRNGLSADAPTPPDADPTKESLVSKGEPVENGDLSVENVRALLSMAKKATAENLKRTKLAFAATKALSETRQFKTRPSSS